MYETGSSGIQITLDIITNVPSPQVGRVFVKFSQPQTTPPIEH